MASRTDLYAKFLTRQSRKPPGPPSYGRNPRQDSYGNPTTKRPGDVGTYTFKDPKTGRTTWLDSQGANRPKRGTFPDMPNVTPGSHITSAQRRQIAARRRKTGS
jgi:hypothetical protein